MPARGRLVLVWLAACAGFDALLASLLDWPLERAVVLAPVVVAVLGAIGFLVVLWTRVALESLRTRHRG